jgi:hypothetical protein
VCGDKERHQFVHIDRDEHTKVVQVDSRYNKINKNFVVNATEIYEYLLRSEDIDDDARIMLRPLSARESERERTEGTPRRWRRRRMVRRRRG